MFCTDVSTQFSSYEQAIRMRKREVESSLGSLYTWESDSQDLFLSYSELEAESRFYFLEYHQLRSRHHMYFNPSSPGCWALNSCCVWSCSRLLQLGKTSLPRRLLVIWNSSFVFARKVVVHILLLQARDRQEILSWDGNSFRPEEHKVTNVFLCQFLKEVYVSLWFKISRSTSTLLSFPKPSKYMVSLSR